MKHKRRSYKPLLAVSIAVLLVLVIFIAFLFENRRDQGPGAIVLPDASAEAPVQEESAVPEADHFVQITTDNVRSVLQSLSMPSFYHQTYSVTVGVDETRAVRQVELWVKGSLIHAEISDETRTKYVLTDGETAYLWYDGDAAALSVPLEKDVTAEDLLGLLSAEQLLSMSQDQIIDADFLVLVDPAQVQCIYVCSQDTEYVTSRYWIDLDTGLMYRADVLEMSKQVYVLQQEGLELLAPGDEAFSERFVLPDGTTPFSTGTETPQP